MKLAALFAGLVALAAALPAVDNVIETSAFDPDVADCHHMLDQSLVVSCNGKAVNKKCQLEAVKKVVEEKLQCFAILNTLELEPASEAPEELQPEYEPPVSARATTEDIGSDTTESGDPINAIDGNDPGPKCRRCLGYHSYCLLGCRVKNPFKDNNCMRKCKAATIKWRSECWDCNYPPLVPERRELEARDTNEVNCEVCQVRYRDCIHYSGTVYLKACMEVCRKRARQSDPICDKCGDEWYPLYKRPDTEGAAVAQVAAVADVAGDDAHAHDFQIANF